MIDEHAIDNKYQYRSANFDEIQETLIIDNLSKSVITNDTLIVDAFSNIFDEKGHKKHKHKKALMLK